MLHFIIYNQIWYISQGLHPKRHSSNANVQKYSVTSGLFY